MGSVVVSLVGGDVFTAKKKKLIYDQWLELNYSVKPIISEFACKWDVR